MKLIHKAKRAYSRIVLRDPFHLALAAWRRDKGEVTRKMNLDLTADSVVVDVGAYIGVTARRIHDRFGCTLHLFEPVPEFHAQCAARFADAPNVTCYNFGLSDTDARVDMNVDGEASAASGASDQGGFELRRACDAFAEAGIGKIDLMEINIEGGEYELLPHLIATGLITDIAQLRIQFHLSRKDASERRDSIREALEETHFEEWAYPFVWESWRRRA